jgi:uncharacterized protein (DUF4415 family)
LEKAFKALRSRKAGAVLVLFSPVFNTEEAKLSQLSRTDWARVASLRDRDIKQTPEHPEADRKHIVRGIARRGLRPLPAKASISLRLDSDVLQWFKAQGPGYQTRINAVLRAFRDASV